ncbi:MAG: MBL fold metallo-hydrolase [Candidatus Aenigmatarchaeota archaeon]
MTKITFFGGLNEIGGNKILIEDGDTRIFFDFGLSFSDYGKFFSEFLKPRKCNGIGDFLEFGLIPDLKGLYREDYLRHMGRKKEEKEFDGVFLSHAHLDHSGLIPYLREDLTIYSSEPTYFILKAMDETNSGDLNEFTTITETFGTYINKKGLISRKNAKNSPEIKRERPYKIFEYGKKIKVDSIEILPFNVDHSLPGATGYIIYTSSGIIVYTGDFRFHGRNGEKSKGFMEFCSREKPDVLIIEGTRVDETERKDESDVEKGVIKNSSKKGLTVCNWPTRDIDRMISFFNASRYLEKKLVINMRQAYLLNLLESCNDVEIPPLDEVEIYAQRKSWGLIGSDWDKKIINEDYESWERELLEDSLCYKDIRAEQENYMFFCSNFDLKDLIDIKPSKDSVYIKSVCEPFDIEMEIDWNRIKNWIDHFGLELFKVHSSGHASGPELKNFVKNVEPKYIFPIHTQNYNQFHSWFKEKTKVFNVNSFDL